MLSRLAPWGYAHRRRGLLITWLLLLGLIPEVLPGGLANEAMAAGTAGAPGVAGTGGTIGSGSASLIPAIQSDSSAATGLLVRVKDVARLASNRTNQVMGIGLVVGLAGTGDSGSNGLTPRLAANLLDRLGVALSESQLRARNVAAVMVTAELPPFARSGDRIDVTVSSLGDARSLQGGVLLQTPLMGADGEVYVVAQGPVSVGGFAAGTGGGAAQQKNHPTVGRVPGGGLVEREIPFTLGEGGQLEWVLHRPDFGMASRLASAIDRAFRPGTAFAQDAATVRVTIPEPFLNNPVAFIAMVEELTLEPVRTAQVVINERTGTVVIGADVRVAPVAVAHGNLRVSITPRYLEIPVTGTAGSGGSTAQAASTPVAVEAEVKGSVTVPVGGEVRVTEESGALQLVEGQTSLAELVASLNALGATPRDLIAILQAIKAAGALYGELVVE